MVAAHIREVPEDKSVPMVRDGPLARALHGVCEIGRRDPRGVLETKFLCPGLCMAMRRRGVAKGVHTIPHAALTRGGRTSPLPDIRDEVIG